VNGSSVLTARAVKKAEERMALGRALKDRRRQLGEVPVMRARVTVLLLFVAPVRPRVAMATGG
jgi:hypothetical protein